LAIGDKETRMMLKDARLACTFQHPVSLGMPNTSISGCKSITLFLCWQETNKYEPK
jgi:hypothetical protein